MTKAKWQKLLEPWGWECARFEERLEKRLKGLPDGALEKLKEAVTFPDRRNCWWASYEAAQKLQSLVTHEIGTRRARFKMVLRESQVVRPEDKP